MYIKSRTHVERLTVAWIFNAALFSAWAFQTLFVFYGFAPSWIIHEQLHFNFWISKCWSSTSPPIRHFNSDKHHKGLPKIDWHAEEPSVAAYQKCCSGYFPCNVSSGDSEQKSTIFVLCNTFIKSLTHWQIKLKFEKFLIWTFRTFIRKL